MTRWSGLTPVYYKKQHIFYLAIGFRSMATSVTNSDIHVKDKLGNKSYSFSISNGENTSKNRKTIYDISRY